MIVITGATGNIGRTLVRQLSEAGETVTAVSRTIGPADVPPGVRAVAADLADPASLRPALDGADALFLLISGDFVSAAADPGGLIADLLDGVKARVVLLSSQGVATRPDSASHGRTGKAIEDVVRQAAADWTILRPGGFASNTYAWAESVRAQRVAASPFGEVGLPYIDPDDIAEVAAAVLRQQNPAGQNHAGQSLAGQSPAGQAQAGPGNAGGGNAGQVHVGQVYELTGPALTTPRERAGVIAEALGEPVRFVEQSREQAREQLLRFMPEPVAETTLAIMGEPTPAEQRISPDVERVLGRAPRTYADWARRNIAAFR